MRGTQTFGGGSAVATSYDNSTSGLSAANVQSAIDEVVSGAFRVIQINSAAGQGTSVAAYSSVDINTGIAPYGTPITYIGRYGGHPRGIVTNVWTSGGTVNATVFNPTNAAITLGANIAIVEFYRI